MDELKKLRERLESSGWRFGPSTKDTGVGWYAWRRLNGAVHCSCNEKAPSLTLTPYEIQIDLECFRSVEFDVCGETASGRWLKLKAYSVKFEEALEAIPDCSNLLLSAWNAAAVAQLDKQEKQ